MPQELLLVNPRKRRRRRRKGHSMSRRRRRNPHKYRYRSMRRRRRNPAMRLPRVGQVTQMLVPAFQGAAGAIATDAAFRMIPLPGALAQLKTGFLAPVTKIAVAIGVGAIANAIGGRQLGQRMTSGALVMIAYDFWRATLARFMPQAAGEYISGLGYGGAGMIVDDSGQIVPNGGMQEYISGMGEGDFSTMEAF